MHPASELTHRTFVHRATAGVKLSIALGVAILTALLPRRADISYAFPGAVVAAAWVLSRMPLWHGLRRLLVAEVLILGIAILSLFSPSATPIFYATLLKSNICVTAMILLTWTTPFAEVIQVLRRVKLPAVMLTTITLMYRYLPVLREESQRMQRARTSRTFSRKNRLAWHSLSAVLAQLFLRSLARAERIYLAMCARGWK